MSNTRLMYFNTNIIFIRISGRHPRQTFAIAKTYFNKQGGITPENL